MNQLFKRVCIFTLISLCFSIAAFAYPSVSPSDQAIFEAKHRINGKSRTEIYVVMRDGIDRSIFYIVPGTPRLETRKTGSKEKPVFHLLRFQGENEDGTLNEGGILQFSVTFGVPVSVKRQLAKKIKQRFKVKKVKFSPFPIKDSQISFYAATGEGIGETGNVEGVGPAFGCHSIPFQIQLQKLGTDIYDSLVKGNGGLPVLVNMTYQGITPKMGAKITVKWDQMYSSFSADVKMKAAASYMKMGGGEGSADINYMKEELMKNDTLKVESLTGEAFSKEDLDGILQMFLPKILDEMFDTTKGSLGFPEQMPVATARSLSEGNGLEGKETAGSGDALGGLGTGVASGVSALGKVLQNLNKNVCFNAEIHLALKVVKRRKSGTQTFMLDKRAIVERKAAFGTCIGIKDFMEYKDELITYMEPGNWQYAMFPLPVVGDLNALGIKSISMQITPVMGRRRIPKMETKTAIIRAKDDPPVWKVKGKEASSISYALAYLYGNKKYSTKVKSLQFGTKMKVSPSYKGGKPFTIKKKVEAFNGSVPLNEPSEFVDIVSVKGRMLTFDESAPAGLAFVEISLNVDGKKMGVTLDSEKKSQTILIPATAKKIIPTITFIKTDGTEAHYKYNGQNMRTFRPSLNLYLFNKQWDPNLVKKAKQAASDAGADEDTVTEPEDSGDEESSDDSSGGDEEWF